MDPLVIGAGISAVSGLLQQDRAQKFERGRIPRTVKQMREAGLHASLAFPGAASSYQNPYVGPDPIGQAATDIGKAESRKQSEAITNTNAKLEGELIQAQIEEAQSRTRLNNVNANRNPSAVPPRFDEKGYPIINTVARYILPSGETILGLNPEAAEVGIGEAVIGLGTIAGGEGLVHSNNVIQSQAGRREYYEAFEKSLDPDAPLGTIAVEDKLKEFEWQKTKRGWIRRKRRENR